MRQPSCLIIGWHHFLVKETTTIWIACLIRDQEACYTSMHSSIEEEEMPTIKIYSTTT